MKARLVAVILLLLVAVARAGVGEWMQKCEQGDGPSCHLAGSVHVSAGDFDAALPLFKKACELGARCQLGQIGDRLHYLGKPDEAKALFELGCAKGEAASCAYLASMLAVGDGVAPDVPGALAILRPMCEGASPWMCGEMARLYRDGDGVSVDLARARDLDARLARSTRDALEHSFKAGREQPERGQQLGAECLAGKADACLNAVMFYAYSMGDAEQALRFTQEECRLSPQTCASWGTVASALGRAGQDARARSVLEAACEARQGTACRHRGGYLFAGEYGPRDLPTAERLVRPECDAGHGNSCRVLGLILSAKRDHKGAHALLVKAEQMRRTEQFGPGNASAQYHKVGAQARASQLESDRIAAAVTPYDAIIKDLGEESQAMVAARRPLDRLDAGTLSDVQNLEHYRQSGAAGASTAADWIARRPARQEAIRKLMQELRATP